MAGIPGSYKTPTSNLRPLTSKTGGVGVNGLERDLEKKLGPENMGRIREIKVGLAGAGGIGSNCAQFLVRSGFKKLKIVDFDVVDHGNLNRQFYFASQVGRRKVEALRENLLLINPDLEIEALPVRIESENVEELFRDCRAVVEALDDAAYKRMVVEALMDSGKLLVAASGLAGFGRSDGIKVRRVRDNLYLVGDMASEAGPGLPALAPGVNVAAAKQADVVLNYFLLNPDGGIGNGG
jgi:sulfur carrier protein ThiS adenylyltransferase